MSHHLADKSQAYRIVLSQLAATLLIAFLLLFWDRVFAYSGFAGGMIAALANGAFAFRVFVPYQAQQPGRLLARFYGGELLKLVITGLLFAAVILWLKPLSVGALFGVYFIVTMMPMFISHYFFS